MRACIFLYVCVVGFERFSANDQMLWNEAEQEKRAASAAKVSPNE